MVKSSHAREANDAGAIRRPGIGGSPGWRIAERGVDALGVVVIDVLLKQVPQMVFAEHDHVIEKLPPNASDEAFSRPVLPRLRNAVRLGKRYVNPMFLWSPS